MLADITKILYISYILEKEQLVNFDHVHFKFVLIIICFICYLALYISVTHIIYNLEWYVSLFAYFDLLLTYDLNLFKSCLCLVIFISFC